MDYRRLKTLKIVDIVGQLATGLGPLIWSKLTDGRFGEGFFFMLFALGSWQLVSFFWTLAIKNTGWKSPLRMVYTVLLGMLVLIGLAGIFSSDALGALAIGGLYAGPALGVLYFIVTLLEFGTLSKRSAITD